MKALILVDIQNDFLPGGALAVPAGDKVIPVINLLQPLFPIVVATQDWHPANHRSFAANHPGRRIFEQIELNAQPSHRLTALSKKAPISSNSEGITTGER